MSVDYDIVVIGCGVTGAGIGREACLHGYKTLVFDRQDFASGASHRSTKLIHGGLRYLATGHIRLVYEALRERNLLLKHLAPNLIDPLEFVYLFRRGDWIENLKICVGLFLYDLLCGLQRLGKHRIFGRRGLRERFPFLDDTYVCGGISYFDAHTDDTRLTMALVRSIRMAGGEVRNYIALCSAEREGKLWKLTLKSSRTGRSWTVRSPVVVVAGGPWTPEILEKLGRGEHPGLRSLTACQGSHLIIDSERLSGSAERLALVLRAEGDKRFTFLVPQWSGNGTKSFIYGTTEVEIPPRSASEAKMTETECRYLLATLRRYFSGLTFKKKELNRAYCGVRPLAGSSEKSLSHISREELITWEPAAGLCVVTGGKLTTFRAMAERVVRQIEKSQDGQRASEPGGRRSESRRLWQAHTADEREALKKTLSQEFAELSFTPTIWEHLVRYYGEDARVVAEIARNRGELKHTIFERLPFTLAEVRYLCENEDVWHLSDLLFRRMPFYFLAPVGGGEFVRPIAEVCGEILGWSEKRRDEEIENYRSEIRRNEVKI